MGLSEGFIVTVEDKDILADDDTLEDGEEETDSEGIFVCEGSVLVDAITVFDADVDTDGVELSEADTDAEPELAADTVGACEPDGCGDDVYEESGVDVGFSVGVTLLTEVCDGDAIDEYVTVGLSAAVFELDTLAAAVTKPVFPLTVNLSPTTKGADC